MLGSGENELPLENVRGGGLLMAEFLTPSLPPAKKEPVVGVGRGRKRKDMEDNQSAYAKRQVSVWPRGDKL